MSLADEIYQNLSVLNDARTAQADYDREAFAREKRGYAKRLRAVADTLSDGMPRDALRTVIADLERAE